MQRTFFHGVGGVVSADIAVPDHSRELAFYSKILTTGDTPFWRKDLMNNLGVPVIGLGVRTPEYSELPLQWMPHFQVADVATSVTNAVEKGGKELWHSKTDDGQSQWAVLSDADGAAFGIIPNVDGEPNSVDQAESFGCISWLSLTVPDVVSSKDFYCDVVGWRVKPCEPESISEQTSHFEMQSEGGVAAAEICQSDTAQNGVPSIWLIHLPVADLDESLRLVPENGGDVIVEYSKSGFAVIRDPVGVYLALQAG